MFIAQVVCVYVCVSVSWMKLCFMLNPNGKIPVRRLFKFYTICCNLEKKLLFSYCFAFSIIFYSR